MSLLIPLSTRVSMRNMEVVDDVCRSAFGCGGVDYTTLALLLVTGAVAALVLAAIVHLADATSAVDEERARLADERDAFDAFARRIDGLDVTEATATVPASGGIVSAADPSGPEGLSAVQDAYRETVMAVDHYEADYGEPLAANLAAELGDELAFAVVDGGELTPQLKSALLSASREASRNRATFLSTLEAEAAALTDARSELEAIDEERQEVDAAPLAERSFEALVADWHRLGELADRCRALTRDRQERLRSLSAATSPTETDLHEYLFEDLGVTHPVLADATSVAETVESVRSRFLRAITRRV